MWVVLSGLVLVGFVGSSLLEGKNPLAMDMGNSPRTVAKQVAYHQPRSHDVSSRNICECELIVQK